MSHILIAGLGDLGRGLAENLLAAGHRVSGIRRGSDAPSGVDLYSQDLLDGAHLLPPDRVDLLVIIMTPSEYSEEGYLKAYMRAPLNLLDALAEQQPLPPILFVSSSGVLATGDEKFFRDALCASHQVIFVHGLEQVVKRPFAQGLDRVFMVRGAEYHEEFSVFEPIEEFQARLIGHLDVQKHQVRGAFLDDLVRLRGARSCLNDLEVGAVLFDLSANRLACRQFIVHNHTPNLHF